jgi:APA family basic amino acid/polyamine antiporter
LAEPTAPGTTSYDRRLGRFDAVMVVVGGIIGAGIFINPAIVAQRVSSAALTLVAWGLGGLVAIIGALCFAELGSRRPEAGGGYVYLREGFGPLPAFLYGWTQLLVINTGGIAAVAMTFAFYTVSLFGLSPTAVKPLAVAAIVLLSGVNYYGIRPGSITQNIFTVLKLLAVAVLVFAGLVLAGGEGGAMAPSAIHRSPLGVIGVLGAALVPVLFAYGGWQHLNNVGAEIRDPVRDLPFAVVGGVSVVVASYMLVNMAYLETLGVRGLAESTAPAAESMRVLAGGGGARFIAAGIMVSTFGFVNLVILAAPRIYQAMADDGVFFRGAARLHPRWRAPSNAILIQGVWAVILTLSGTYAQLLDYVVFGDWIFFGLIVATMFIYRRRIPGPEPRVFRMPGYPVLPAFFVFIAVFVVVSTVVSNPLNAALGAVIITAGVPVFLVWRDR